MHQKITPQEYKVFLQVGDKIETNIDGNICMSLGIVGEVVKKTQNEFYILRQNTHLLWWCSFEADKGSWVRVISTKRKNYLNESEIGNNYREKKEQLLREEG